MPTNKSPAPIVMGTESSSAGCVLTSADHCIMIAKQMNFIARGMIGDLAGAATASIEG
jgi:hypothetical protein